MPPGRVAAIKADICERIGDGSNLNLLCAEDGFPSRPEVYRWLREDHEFLNNYREARECRADSRSDRIDDHCRATVAGDMDPNVARVVISAEQWQAGREAPKKYGDKPASETNVNVNIGESAGDVIGFARHLAFILASGAAESAPVEAVANKSNGAANGAGVSQLAKGS